MKFWMAWTGVRENRGRAFFPIFGVIGAISALIMTLSLGRGGNSIIDRDLSSIGRNRAMIGGANLNSRDIKIIENIPFVEYALFVDSREKVGDNIFIGYTDKALTFLNMERLRDGEIIVDKNQFPDILTGSNLKMDAGYGVQNFRVKDRYEEQNPMETMKEGNRIIISQDMFARFFGDRDYKRVVVSLSGEESSEDILPLIVKQLNRGRGSSEEVRILETPEVYKRVEKIKKLVNSVLGTLSIIALMVGGFGIMNLIGASIRERTGTIGILRAMGYSRNSVTQIFLLEAGIIVGIGSIFGTIFGVVGSILAGNILKIPPVFSIGEIILAIFTTLAVGLVLGLKPAYKAGKMETVEALKTV